MIKNNKILLIGSSGQLGSAILRDAPVLGYKISAPSHKELDISDIKSLERVFEVEKPDIVINAAAYNITTKCEDTPLEAMAVNFVAVANMAKISKKRNIKFITYSTDYVFDGEEGKPNNEDTEPNPLQNYGISKAAGEKASLNIYPEGTWVVRTSALYGGGMKGSPQKGNFVLNVIRNAKEMKKIDIASEQIVSPTFSEDLSHATFQMIEKASPGIYHLVNEGNCSWYEFGKFAIELAGITADVRPVNLGCKSGEMHRPRFSALANEKAKALGIILPDWKSALKVYINSLG